MYSSKLQSVLDELADKHFGFYASVAKTADYVMDSPNLRVIEETLRMLNSPRSTFMSGEITLVHKKCDNMTYTSGHGKITGHRKSQRTMVFFESEEALLKRFAEYKAPEIRVKSKSVGTKYAYKRLTSIVKNLNENVRDNTIYSQMINETIQILKTHIMESKTASELRQFYELFANSKSWFYNTNEIIRAHNEMFRGSVSDESIVEALELLRMQSVMEG